MPTSVTLNGTSYNIPLTGESNWGDQVSNYLIALATGVLSKAGGSFTLTADADFGANYGLKAIYYKSRGTTSATGVLRLANNEGIGWRDSTNSSDLILKVNASDVLEFNGNPVGSLTSGTSTDNAVARYDGTTGDLQDSGIFIYDDDRTDIGDPGLESSGIDVNGVTYATGLRINEFGNVNPVQFMLHRHSTSIPAAIMGSRSNSADTSHGAVTNGQALLSMYAAGWTGSHYDLAAQIDFSIDSSGTVSATSAPGALLFKLSPDGSTTPVTALKIGNDKKITIYDDIDTDSARALSVGASVGANALTLGGATSTVNIPGNLDLDGYLVNPLILTEESSTPSNPSSGYKKLYPKDDGKLYTLDSSGNEIEVGSGAGSGSINYLENPDGATDLDKSATNDLQDWINEGTDITLSVTTTEAEIPLYPVKDTAIKMLLVASGTDPVRPRFRIPASEINQYHRLDWHQIVGSTYETGDMTVELYSYSDSAFTSDETQVTLALDDGASSNIRASNGEHPNAFMPPNTNEYFELRFISNKAGASTDWVAINNVTVSPKGVAKGIDKWRQYSYSAGDFSYSATPTGFSAGDAFIMPFKTADGQWWAHISIEGTITGATSGTLAISGFTFESSIGYQPISFLPQTAAAVISGYCFGGNGNITFNSDTSTTYFNCTGTVKLDSKPTWASDQGMAYELNNSLINSNVRMFAERNTDQTTSGETIVAWNNAIEDDWGMLNTSTGEITIPEDGWYHFNTHIHLASATTATSYMYAYVSGTNNRYMGSNYMPSTAIVMGTSGGAYLYAGDVVTIRTDCDDKTIDGDPNNENCYVEIVRDSEYHSPFPTGHGLADENRAGLIDFYKDSGEQSASFTNNGGTHTNNGSTYRVVRVGNLCTVSINMKLSASSKSAGDFNVITWAGTTGNLPTWAEPYQHGDASASNFIDAGRDSDSISREQSVRVTTNSFQLTFIDGSTGGYVAWSGAIDCIYRFSYIAKD